MASPLEERSKISPTNDLLAALGRPEKTVGPFATLESQGVFLLIIKPRKRVQRSRWADSVAGYSKKDKEKETVGMAEMAYYGSSKTFRDQPFRQPMLPSKR